MIPVWGEKVPKQTTTTPPKIQNTFRLRIRTILHLKQRARQKTNYWAHVTKRTPLPPPGDVTRLLSNTMNGIPNKRDANEIQLNGKTYR
jgi:hypothetical protein